MNTIFKAGCVGIYLMAIISLFAALPGRTGPLLQTIALALLAVHALEMAFAYKYVKTYKGPLLHSIALALLFGLLHWMPLAKEASRNKRPS
jgi:uncharacterized protein YhhL (DUF1145 family)